MLKLKNRFIATILALLVIISMFAVIPVDANEMSGDATPDEVTVNRSLRSPANSPTEAPTEAKEYSLDGNITVVDTSVIGKIKDGTAYVKNGSRLKLNLSELNWSDIDTVKIEYEDGTFDSVTKYSASKNAYTLSKVDGKVSIHVVFPNGKDVIKDISEWLSFSSIKYDTSGISVSNVSLGDETISEGKWVITNDGDLVVIFNSDDSVADNVSIKLNDTSLICTYVDSLIYKVANSELSEKLSDTNTLEISAVNSFGSVVNYSISFKYDSSSISLGKAELSDVYYETDNYVYSKSGNSLSLKVNAGVSGLKKAEIYRNGVLSKSYTDSEISYDIKEEGIYSIKVQSNSGKELSSVLLGGKSVRFDDEKPAVKEYKYLGEKATEKWYNSKGLFEIVVEDNMPFDGKEYSLLINDIEVTCDVKVEENTVVYSVDLSGVNSVKDGENNIVFNAKDRLGNSVGLLTVLKIDTKKPTTDGTSSNIYTEEGGVTYYKDKLIISGKFTDDISGVSKVLYSEDGENYHEMSLPSEVKETGYLRVVDNANNELNISVKDWLKSIGVSKFVVDRDNPSLGFILDKADYVKDGKMYYKSIPSTILSISDIEFRKAEIYVGDNLVKELSKSDITSDEGIYFKPDNIPNGEAEVKIKVFDIVNHLTEKSVTFVYDNTPPEITKAVANSSPDNYKDGNIIFKNRVSVTVDSQDSLVGVKRYVIKDSGGNVIYSEDGDSSISFKPENGKSYTVAVEDFLGNTSESVDFGKLLGWEGSTFIFDSVDPIIDVKTPDNSYSRLNNWYGEDVVFSFIVDDLVGVDSVVVTINGETVDSFDADTLGRGNIKLSADTSLVNSPDGRYDITITAKDVALNSVSWSTICNIDRTTPVVSDFLISGDVKRIGKTIGGSDNTYGFFFNGNGKVEVSVDDGDISSGIYAIYTKLDGQDWVKNETSGLTSVVVNIPEDYKGYIYAKAEDNVSHESSTEMPDGLVSESSNTAINMSSIDITMPTPVGTDNSGLPLYSSDTSSSILISSEWSGIESISWGLNDETYGTITDMSSAEKFDKNLALSFSTVASLTGNSNNIRLWVSAVTNAGNVINNSKYFSIDKDAPVITVSYDTTKESGYYNTTRVATITINERNFDSSLVSIEGSDGSVGNWSSSGDIWTNTVTYASDGDYQLIVNCTDRAGNKASTYNGEKFTIDKTNPTLSVSWDNNNSRNGKYYNNSRTATVTVVERNFDSSLMTISGASFNGWSDSGDTHTTTVSFNSDGEYEFSISGADKATNKIDNDFSSGEFTVDMTKPTVVVQGVEKGISYKNDLMFSVSLDDKYIDYEISSVKLYGKNHEELNITGTVSGSTIYFSYGDFPKDEDTDDVYTLVITAMDMAGNSSSEEFSFSVNRFGSKYSFYDAEVLGNYINEARDIKITETNVDKIDTSKLKIVVSRDGVDTVLTEKDIKIEVEEVDGKYVYTYTISKDYFKGDGKYAIQVYSTSDDGTEYTSVTEEYSFILDTTSPEIVISGVETNGSYRGYERLVTIEVRDLSGASVVDVTLNGVPVNTEYADDLYQLTIKENPNKQHLLVTVSDNAGNISSAEVKDFSISSNYIVYLWNQLWFKILLGLLLLIAVLLIALMVYRVRKSRADEKALAKENDAYYHGSSSGNNVVSEESVTDVMTSQDVGSTDIQDTASDDSPTDIIE